MNRRSVGEIFDNPKSVYEITDKLVEGRSKCQMCNACCNDTENFTITRMEFERLRGKEYFNPESKGTCVFLSDKGCSVYEDRPIECRIYNVIDDRIFVHSLKVDEETLPERELAIREAVYTLLKYENLQKTGDTRRLTIREWLKIEKELGFYEYI